MNLPVITIQWRLRRNEAKNRFKKELIASGIPPEDAKELADMYPFKLGDFLSLTRKTSDN
ncbi:MAG: hypothetical protein JSV18_07665 [Candidatus Bathyarchaeota archaeon]|nr:MAG: hypothetical protein JSV18_07665 [Candidatus Bathyarchaeota archaeon]